MEMNKFFLLTTLCLCISLCAEAQPRHFKHETKLPIGDKTLSSKEIIANESQERMGLLIDEKHIEHVRKIAERERAPLYVVGETTDAWCFSSRLI